MSDIFLQKPYGGDYSVETFGTDFIFKVIIRLGFKEEQLLDSVGSTKFFLIKKVLLTNYDLPTFERIVIT